MICGDADGKPTQVRLVDSGEHVVVYDTTSTDTERDTSFFLNDPDTFDHNPADDQDTLMMDEIMTLTPLTFHIGADEVLDQEVDYRYLSFNMGLMRDNIFQLCKENVPTVPYKNPVQEVV